MTCTKCDGLMVSERIVDLQGMSSDLCVDGYRCLLCGDVIDATILEHRKRSTGAAEPRPNVSARPLRLVAA